MRGNYPDAWVDIKGLIDAHFPFPKHQGVTDITEHIEFARIAGEWNLTNKQYERLIDQAQKYHDQKARIERALGEDKYAEVWTGNVRDLVRKIASSDARYSAIDARSGAHVRLNLDSDALMYVTSPDGENLIDCQSMHEARQALAIYRRNPDASI
jgi:hypothetical protein